jgi:plasmid stabilization system protein ParE
VARVRIEPTADAQADAADDWWRANRPAARDRFAVELESAVALLSEFPGVGVPYRRREIPRLRRLLLATTRYHLYYVHDTSADEVRILAVWSAVRGRTPPLLRAP